MRDMLTEKTTRETDAILRLPEVLRRTGLAKTTIYRKAGEGSFPLPRKLSGRAVGWTEGEITSWMRNLNTSQAPD